jgi:PilZ domain-containing protein
MPQEYRRRFTRLKYDVPAVITVGSTVFSIKGITNLSIGGALIPCEQNFEDLTECVFQIPIGGTTNNLCIEVKGEFVWSNSTQAAIKFTDIDPDSLMLLQNIIRYNAEDVDEIDAEIEEHRGLI